MSQETATRTGQGFRSTVSDIVVDPRKLRLRHQVGLFGLLLLFLVPVPLTAVTLSGIIGILYTMMFAMSWDFVSGYTGQISFGHTFFFAIGGYGAAILNVDHGVHPVLAVLVATVLAGIGGILLGVPALRLRGPYLSLVTLIAPIIMFQIFILRSDIFRGTSGFITQPTPIIGGPDAVITITGANAFITQTILQWYLALGLFTVLLLTMYAITRSDAGDVFTAIREDEDTVAASGLNPAKFKIFAFVGSGIAGGLAGAMYATTGAAGTVVPQNFIEISVAINVIIISVIGGMGTIVGGAVGGIFFAGTQTILGGLSFTIPLLNKTPGDLTPLPLFLVALLVLFYAPGGIVRAVTRFLDDVEDRRRGETAGGGGDSGKGPLERRIESARATTKEKLQEVSDRL